MTRANSRVKVEDQAAYRVALKQRTTCSAPNPALNSHGEDVPGAGSVGAQNIERTFAMVEEQMFLLTACWTLHCMPCQIIFNSANEQAVHNSKWHWDEFLCFACDIGFETATDLKKVSPRSRVVQLDE
ncbi:uncharacterized protein FMAN_01752 [Fusarium mangiferae]|uniref:Uncharacterized protein n=1 Tax=Fusarium mangiferae TaxID=192010 RepID=A0A1L7SEP0_FUSMA|nr:uncharacterized protein FMAN_01752 [Fusarium mangiferae]CVK84825.1 uncharacterized protein FMAN_01752 [Fusarium mangiferae]